jgi:hypothetical protein
MFGRRRPADSTEAANPILASVPTTTPAGLNMPIRRGMSIATPEEQARIDEAARNDANAVRKRRDDEAQRRQQAQMAWARHRDILRARVSDLRGQAGDADGRVYQARADGDVAAAAIAEAQRQVLQRWADEAQRELDTWQRTQPF